MKNIVGLYTRKIIMHTILYQDRNFLTFPHSVENFESKMSKLEIYKVFHLANWSISRTLLYIFYKIGNQDLNTLSRVAYYISYYNEFKKRQRFILTESL